MRLVVDNTPVPIAPGDSVLLTLLRSGLHPTGGGCLCLAGDCPHCLATVDGVAYVRTCQARARPGTVVERHHAEGDTPPLIREDRGVRSETKVRHRHCDVVVIGLGPAGQKAAKEAREAGRDVVALDATQGQHVAGIYPGPLLVVRTDDGTLLIHPRDEIVVATGAAEIQPVAPGAELRGLLTARATSALAAAGLDLGRVVAVGMPPEGVEAEPAQGDLVRFEGTAGQVEAVVVRVHGAERRYACDTVSLGLGLYPRDALARMGRGLPVRVLGGAARTPDLPPCPRAGTVCACSGVTVEDLARVWENGFHELELVKRATLAGTGTCQGAACLPHLRSFLAERGKKLQPPFTARPLTRQLTLGELAAGAFHPSTPRTALHEEHLRLGARMERAGGWWRPWNYGDRTGEYWAVREGVSIADVGTLGKFLLSGPGALELLEHLYPIRVASLKPGRSRYVLLLDERGYVLDDGLICRESETRFLLTLTSAGSTLGELWIRDWAEARGADVRLMNQTMSLGAINVTGPLAAELLARAGAAELPAFARHRRGTVAGVPCRILRLSFTGELSYELHHAAADSVTLWRRLLDLGRDLGVRPHGLEALLDLRLEKGHLVVGKDTDFDSTPRRLMHTWAVDDEKPDFVGRQAVLRTDKVPLNRQLVGLEMALPAPIDGAVVWDGAEYAGYVTSSAASPRLGKAVMFAWVALRDGELPAEVTIDGRPARRVPTPFYDPEGSRARVKVAVRPAASVRFSPPVPDGDSMAGVCVPQTRRFRRIEGTRVVTTPAALDRAHWPEGALVLKTAADEALVTAPVQARAVPDPHAIVERETGFAGVWLEAAQARAFLERACSWEIPAARPAFAQGAVANIPVKLWLEKDRVFFVVAAAHAQDLEERM